MVSNFGFGLLEKTVALFLFGPLAPQTKILQKEKVLVLMWTESLFTVYQALHWELFSDAEGTFSHLSGPVRKKYLINWIWICWIRQLLDTQNRVILLPGEQQNRFMKIIYRYLGKRLDLAFATDGIPRECFVPAGKVLARKIPSSYTCVELHCARTYMHCELQLSTAAVLWACACWVGHKNLTGKQFLPITTDTLSMQKAL